MKVLSLFSGVGGFDLGLENAGMETVFQCEWDKHATKILEKHWPHVPRWGDVTTLTGQHILAHAPVIDVVAWGSPCQDLSVAGKRAGLQGARSGLFYEGVRIIKELRELTNGKYPRISIWENVAGALSSGAGADFGQVLTEMDEAGSCFSEWRVLDAQYFGVPQRRRRVFLISVFDPATAARCPDPLLPVSESVRRDTQAGAATREEPASETPASPRGGGDDVAGSLTWRMKNGYNGQDAHSNLLQVIEEPPILIDRGAFNQGKNAQYKPIISEDPVVPSLVARGPHAVYTKSKRPQTATDDETWVANQPNPTLNAFDQGDTRATTVIVQEPMVFQPGAMVRLGTKPSDGIVPTLRAEVKRGDNEPVIAYETEPVMLNYQGSKGNAVTTEDGVSFTLNAMHGHDVHVVTQPTEDPIVFENSYRDAARIAEHGITQTLTSKMGTGGGNTPMVAFGLQGNMIGRQDHNGPQGAGISQPGDPMFSLTSTDRHAIATTLAVRRLTPLECERLMGWPDDWTAGQSDTHRYKQCGNGVASPVAQWIAQQLLQLDNQ